MIGRTRGFVAGLALALAAFTSGADAATKEPPADSSSPVQILPGTGSKEPITIDADKLVYFDKEKKAVYSGNVVVVQGDTKMTCSTMTVYLEQIDAKDANGKVAAAEPEDGERRAGKAPPQNSGIRRLEAAGPVTVVSKTQVATGDKGVYEKAADRVQLIGHVTLTDGPNVTKGDKLTYDLKTGQATVETSGGKSGRVHGQFTPNPAPSRARLSPASPQSRSEVSALPSGRLSHPVNPPARS